MATVEKEVEASLDSQEEVGDNDTQSVLSTTTGAVDPGGVHLTADSQATPTHSPTSQSNTPIVAHKTAPAPGGVDLTYENNNNTLAVSSANLEQHHLPPTPQSLIATIIQSNPNYTFSVIQSTPHSASGVLETEANNSVSLSRPETCTSTINNTTESPPLNNTASVIVLANSGAPPQFANTHTNKPHLPHTTTQHSIEVETTTSSLSQVVHTPMPGGVGGQSSSYIPQVPDLPATSSVDSAGVLSSDVTHGQTTTVSGIDGAALPVSSSQLLMNDNTHVFSDNKLIRLSQIQTNLNNSSHYTPINTSSSISRIPMTTVNSHSVITSSLLLDHQNPRPGAAGEEEVHTNNNNQHHLHSPNPPPPPHHHPTHNHHSHIHHHVQQQQHTHSNNNQTLLQQLQAQQQQQQQQQPPVSIPLQTSSSSPSPSSSQSPLLSLSNFVLASPLQQQKELLMRTSAGTPPLSASDVLMNTYNVLEDGDRYQVNNVPAQTPQEYEDSGPAQTYTQWSESDLDHNRSAILKALQEPTSINLGETDQGGGPRSNFDKTALSQKNHWAAYKEKIDSSKYPPVEMVKVPSVVYTSMENAALPPVSPSYPNTATDGPTTALKSAFAGAHFLCKFCPERFRIPEKLTEHIKRVHSGSVVYTCFTCGKKFYNSHDLREHVPTHANEPIKCSLCNLTLESTKELRAHHKKAHPLAAMSCPLCDKVFGSSSTRAKHLRAEHRGDKHLIECDQCGDPFIDRAAYEEHMRTHRKTMHAIQSGQLTPSSQRHSSTPTTNTIVIWKCDKCGVIFPNDVELGKHTSTAHPPEVISHKLLLSAAAAPELHSKLNSASGDVPATKYELLRLLLRRKKAADAAHLGDEHAKLRNQAAAYPSLSGTAVAASQYDANSRPPDELLSAETVQHVADELSILQSMNPHKHVLKTFGDTPLTADALIDPDSTMGINLTVSKNTSPTSKVNEIRKHKTLVNMLTGTVASIIEREVKDRRPPIRSMSLNEPIVSHQNLVTGCQTNVSYSPPVTKATTLQPFSSFNQASSVSVLPNEFAMISNNVGISNNDNAILSPPPSSHHQIVDQVSVPPQYTTTSSQGTYHTSNLQSPAQHVGQDTSFQQELRSFLDMSQNLNNTCPEVPPSQEQMLANKLTMSTSSWDSHIGPLIKLFQNANPDVPKIPGDIQGAKSSQDDIEYAISDQGGSANARDDSGILDLSSHRSNYPYDVGSQQARVVVSDINSSQISTGRLPHFNEVSWAPGREKNTDTGLYEKRVDEEATFYDNYSTYTNPHSDLNQMSGGHLTYVQTSEPSEPATSFYEHSIQSAQYIPTREQSMTPILQPAQYVHGEQQDHENIPQSEVQRLQSDAELQVLQDQHLNLLNPQQLQHQQHLLLQEHQELQNLQQQHSAVSPEETHVQHPQFLENTNDSFSQMLQDNNILQMQTEHSMESLPSHHQGGHHRSDDPNNAYQNHQYQTSPTDGGQGNGLIEQENMPILSQEHQYLEPNNNTTSTTTEFQRLCEKFSKGTKPQHEGLRNMLLARKFYPEVPLVFRHKLLATMLKEGTMEGTVSPPKEPDSTTDSSPHPGSLMVPDGGGVGGNPQVVTHYINPSLNDGDNFIEQQDKLMALNATRGGGLHPSSNGGHSNDQTTVDQQLLSQMISDIPATTCDVHTSWRVNMKKHDLPPPLMPHPDAPPSLALPVSRSEALQNQIHLHQSPVLNVAAAAMVPPSVSSNGGTTATTAVCKLTDLQRRLSYEKCLGARCKSTQSKRTRSKPCPAIHKRRVTVIIQKAEDAFVLSDDCATNVTAEKRRHSCEEFCCRVAKVAKPTPTKSRGRPPKNGQMPMKKGSYKKGQYPCPICKKVYAWKNYLRIHIAKHDKKHAKKEEAGSAGVQDDDMPPLLPPLIAMN